MTTLVVVLSSSRVEKFHGGGSTEAPIYNILFDILGRRDVLFLLLLLLVSSRS